MVFVLHIVVSAAYTYNMCALIGKPGVGNLDLDFHSIKSRWGVGFEEEGALEWMSRGLMAYEYLEKVCTPVTYRAVCTPLKTRHATKSPIP